MKKHALWLATVVALGGCVVSSCESSNYQVVSGEPDYTGKSETNVMRIGAWVAPPIGNWNQNGNDDFVTQECYDDVAESGINVIYDLYARGNQEATLKALEYAKNAGIKYLARDYITQDPEAMELEQGDLHKITEAYDSHEALAGWLMSDEPSADDFDMLGRLHTFFKNEYPGKEFYVNLFPTYANISQTKTDNYGDYLDQYIEKVNPDFLSYDHYCMMQDGYGNKKLTEDVLWNLEMVANRCKAAGIPMYTFVQAMSYDLATRVPNEAEIRFQVLTQMAYGSRSLQYFCYWTPLEFTMGSPAMITVDGEKTDIYYAVKNVNAEIRAWDEAYLEFTWEGTLPIVGTNNDPETIVKQFAMMETPLTEVAAIASYEATENTIIGTFKGNDERDAFLIQNFTDPAESKTDDVSVTFNNATHALVYHGTEKSVVELQGGTYDVSIAPGDGVFVIPYR